MLSCHRAWQLLQSFLCGCLVKQPIAKWNLTVKTSTFPPFIPYEITCPAPCCILLGGGKKLASQFGTQHYQLTLCVFKAHPPPLPDTLVTGLWLGSHSKLPQSHFLPVEKGLWGRWMCLGKGFIPYTMLIWIPVYLGSFYGTSENLWSYEDNLCSPSQVPQITLMKGKMAGNTPKKCLHCP